MKTISHLLLLATACISTRSFAQTTSIGFTAGTSIAHVKTKIDKAETSDSETGFMGGVVVNLPLSSHFSIQPALNFVQKGGKMEDRLNKELLTLNYLELPVNFVYNTNEYHGFFVGGGPALSAGSSGKTKSTLLSSNTTTSHKVKFGSNENEDDIKRMEFSANVLAGYRFSAGFQVAVTYNLGLSNLIISSNDGSFKNRYFGVGLCYLIPSKTQ